jgi:hypothetical protein
MVLTSDIDGWYLWENFVIRIYNTRASEPRLRPSRDARQNSGSRRATGNDLIAPIWIKLPLIGS